MRKYIPILSFIILFLSVSYLFAADIGRMPPFTKGDRILILAAHPDDEAIGAAGVIQKALKAGAKVRVVCYTNGENNEPSFIVYEKRLTFRKGEFIHMGEVRRKEAVKAMDYLGVHGDGLIFLGYPDFGTMEIFTKYWGRTKPFKNIFVRASKVPYPECLSPSAPYVGESILSDIKKVILDFKPTKIFVNHPVDTNRDHRSLYLFLQVALWDLEGRITAPEVFLYLIHVKGWPMPRGYHPELSVEPPQGLEDVQWKSLPLDEDEVNKKYEAISLYTSQTEYSCGYLFTFARKNELFDDYPVIVLKDGTEKGLIWSDINVPKSSGEGMIAALGYARSEDSLFVKFNLKRKIDKNMGISIFLIGYNKKTDFAAMPKIYVSIGVLGMRIRDKKDSVLISGAKITYEGNAVILKMPLSSLGNPDYIMSSARDADLPFNKTAWRIIKLNR